MSSAVSLAPPRMREQTSEEAHHDPGLNLTGRRASKRPASDIYVVTGTAGNDGGFEALVELMGERGLPFYRSETAGGNRGPAGLIGRDDLILVKINSQWDERGGSNTDLLRAVIEATVAHPDRFVGEVVVADNGQVDRGSAGSGGSFEWERNNAQDPSLSARMVVDSFAGAHRVSTYRWDDIATRRVGEYAEGDLEDGYVVEAAPNPRTGILVSYPKFRTRFGTYVSFKRGLWRPSEGAYDGDGLKVVNVPVLKSHRMYGVTASVKSYMGVGSDKLTSQLGGSSHRSVGSGGMGTLMAETRFPILNIIDAIYVNAIPERGPRTSYDDATMAKVVAASVDPPAIDHWAAKNILLQLWRMKTNSTAAQMDPDKVDGGAYGAWLRLSMDEMIRAGRQATVDEERMNVYLTQPPPRGEAP